MRSHVDEIIRYKDYTIQIQYDEDCESPNDWDNGMFLVTFHRQCYIRVKGFDKEKVERMLRIGEWATDDDEVALDTEKYFVFSVGAYIHSGVMLYLGDRSRDWDSGPIGFLFCEKREPTSTELLTGNGPHPSEVQQGADSFIELWNDYLSGSVWAYSILDEKSESIEDGYCGGYYGEEGKKDAISEAKAIIDSLVGGA